MSITVTQLPGSLIAYYRDDEPLDDEQREQVRHAIVQFCQERGLSDVIVEGGKHTPETDTLESFVFTNLLSDAMEGFRLAIVHAEHGEETQFLGEMAADRGLTVRTFADVNEARAWLESSDSNEMFDDDSMAVAAAALWSGGSA